MKHLIIFFVAVFINTAYAQFGTQVGEFSNVKAYSNGSVNYVSNQYNSFNGTNTGMTWQCVEYVNRFYASVYGLNIRIAGQNANEYYSNASARGLQAHANGGSTPPQVGDILCLSGGQYGHVAIIREVSATAIRVIQQNWSNSSSDNSMTLSFNATTNSVSGVSTYSVQGWLRRSASSGGFIKVKTGLSVPTTVVKGVQFNVEFALKETNNLPITLQAFAVSVHKPDGSFLFDIHLSNNVSFSPGEEKFYNFSATVHNVSTTPPGTYTVRAKGQMNNAWFDIQTLSGATNPKSFSLVNPTLSVSPTTRSVSSGAGNFNVSVSSNVPWTVSSNQSWLTSTSSSGSNNETINVSYAANASSSVRTGKVTIKATLTGDQLTAACDVTQEGIQTYTLSLSKGGSGDGRVRIDGVLRSLPYTATYNAGSSVSLEAVPEASTFSGWTGSVSSNASTVTVTMNSNKNITANFTALPVQYTLSLVKGGSGDGRVRIDGVLRSLPYTATYNAGSSVSLEAVPEASTFSGWTGSVSSNQNPISVTMNADKNITASFTALPVQYTLSLVKGGSGSGKVKVDNVIRNLPYNAQYNAGTSVSIEAVPEASTFTGWSGSASGNQNPISVTMNADKNITASFTALPVYTLSLTKTGSGNGKIKVNGTLQSFPFSAQYNEGTSITLEVVPDVNNTFIGWSGALIGTSNPMNIVLNENISAAAEFSIASVSYTLTLTKGGDADGKVKVNGTVRSLPFSAAFTSGSSVSLEAVPEQNATFASWGGSLSGSVNPTSVTMDENKSVTANFNAISLIPLIPATANLNVIPGQEFWIDVQIGTSSQPVTDLKVVSFTMQYTNTAIVDYMSYEVGAFITGAQATVVPNDPFGMIDASVYRTSGGNSGTGVVIRFKMKISTNAQNGQQSTISFPSVLANDANGNAIVIAPQILTLTVVNGATVWPGDTDNNATVNIFDVNKIIVAYGIAGPVRPTASSNWTGQFCTFWSPAEITYADCDGNGIINIFDINSVIVNYGLSHSFANPVSVPLTTLSDPPLQMVGPLTPLNPADTFEVSLLVGSASLPVTNLKVVSFEMKWNNKAYLDYISHTVGDFITGAQASVIPTDSMVAASVYRTSGGNSGMGTLIKFKFRVVPNTPIPTSFDFRFEQVLANRDNGSVQPLTPLGTQIMVPVEMTSFTASAENGIIKLHWSTATETNNKGFDVERKTENGWQKIGFVNGAGSTSMKRDYSFTDDFGTNAYSGTVEYRLKQIDFNGTYDYSDVVSIKVDFKPVDFVLHQNYPNPFNPTTRISYAIPMASFVTLRIYDVIGNEVATLVNENKDAGYYNVTFEAGNLSNGVYFYELLVNGMRLTKKLTLLK